MMDLVDDILMMDLGNDAAAPAAPAAPAPAAPAPAAQYTEQQVTEYLGTVEGFLNDMHNDVLVQIANRGGVNVRHRQLLMRIISSADRVISDVEGLLGAPNANIPRGRGLYGVGGTNSLRI